MIAMMSPERTVRPGEALISRRRPAAGLETAISIFMDSITATVSPAATLSPMPIANF